MHLNTFVEFWGAGSSLNFNQVLLLGIFWRQFLVDLSNSMHHIVCTWGMDTYLTCYLFLHPWPCDLFIHFGELPFLLWCVLQGLSVAWEWAVWLSNFSFLLHAFGSPPNPWPCTRGYGPNQLASHCSLGFWECLSRGPWGRGENSPCFLASPGKKASHILLTWPVTEWEEMNGTVWKEAITEEVLQVGIWM